MSQHTPQESEQTAAKEQDIDQESVLSNIDFNTDLNHNLNLSEYCISSDADTEKMDSNEETSLASLPELRYAPKLASLVKQETPSGSVKRPYQDEVYEQQEDTKKIKVAEKEETGVAGGKEKSVDLRDEQGDRGRQRGGEHRGGDRQRPRAHGAARNRNSNRNLKRGRGRGRDALTH